MDDVINPSEENDECKNFLDKNTTPVEDYQDVIKRVRSKSLNDLVSEELPKILELNSLIFTLYEMPLPENHEFHIYLAYRDNADIVKDIGLIYDCAKFVFKDIHRYLKIKDEQRLDSMVLRYKKILEGKYVP